MPRIKLKADTAAIARARDECAAHTRNLTDPETRYVACLLVSELVTNTIRHGGGEPGDTLEIVFEAESGDSLYIAVCQRGPVGRVQVESDPLARRGGWGLRLVDQLAAEWGVQEDPHCVWFRLAA